MTDRPQFPPTTAAALRKNGWHVGNRTADRDFGGGVRAIIDTTGAIRVLVNDITRFEGHEPAHETLEWTICCTAMEANEVAWSQSEYKDLHR